MPGSAPFADAVPGHVALELVHRYGAIVVNLASAVIDVADDASPEIEVPLRAAVREARVQLIALVDAVASAALAKEADDA